MNHEICAACGHSIGAHAGGERCWKGDCGCPRFTTARVEPDRPPVPRYGDAPPPPREMRVNVMWYPTGGSCTTFQSVYLQIDLSSTGWLLLRREDGRLVRLVGGSAVVEEIS